MQRIRLRRRPARADSVRKHGERRCCIVSAQLLGHVNEERVRLPKWVLVLKPEANFCVPVLLSMKVEFDSDAKQFHRDQPRADRAGSRSRRRRG